MRTKIYKLPRALFLSLLFGYTAAIFLAMVGNIGTQPAIAYAAPATANDYRPAVAVESASVATMADLPAPSINIAGTNSFNGLFTAPQPVFTSAENSGDSIGYYARSRATDTVANTSERQKANLVIALDTSTPTVVLTTPVTHSGLEPFSIQWEAEDPQNNISTVTLTYSGPDSIFGSHIYTFTNSNKVSDQYTLPQNDMAFGKYTITLRADNNIGNSSTVTDTTDVKEVKIYLPLVLKNYPPSWVHGNGTADINFRDTSFCGNNNQNAWYAGTNQDGVWKSDNNGANWSKIVNITEFLSSIVTNPNDSQCNEAFVSRWGQGVNKIVGTNISPINTGLNEDRLLYMYGLAITGTTLYAGTYQDGVFKTDINTINWQEVNNGISERRIRSLNIFGNTVYAGARDCTLYTSNNQGNTWTKHSVLTSGCNDAQVWSVAQVGTTIFAGLGSDKGLYYSNNNTAWVKVNSVPEKTIYGLAYDQSHDKLYVSTYGAGIYRCDMLTGVPVCTPYNYGLTTLNTREMAIGGSRIIVSTDNGSWYLDTF